MSWPSSAATSEASFHWKAISTLLTNIIVSVDITIINTIFASNFRWIFYPKNSSHSKLHFITTVTTIKN